MLRNLRPSKPRKGTSIVVNIGPAEFKIVYRKAGDGQDYPFPLQPETAHSFIASSITIENTTSEKASWFFLCYDGTATCQAIKLNLDRKER